MNQELFERGLAVRRAVVGDTYVDASLAAADEFSMPMQELVTEFCWGEVWTRPGLARRQVERAAAGLAAGGFFW